MSELAASAAAPALPQQQPVSLPVQPHSPSTSLASAPALSPSLSSSELSAPPTPSHSAMLSPAPTLSGLLWKKGSTFGGWTQRFYRLHPELSRIQYSKAQDSPVRGELLLSRFTVVDLAATAPSPAVAASLAGQFRIECPNRSHVLRCDEAAQLPLWIEALQKLSQANESRRRDSLAKIVKAGGNSNPVLQTASHCASCKESFGLTRSKQLCAGSCGLVYCSSLSCMEPKSLHGNVARCCRACAEARDASMPPQLTPMGSDGALLSSGGKKGGGTALSKRSGSTAQLIQHSKDPKLRASNANLLIRVLAGRHLMICDASGSSDPYVCIFFDGQEYRTEVQDQTLNPTWNAQFSIPITGQSRDIQIGVYDADRYSNDDFMGMVHIPLSSLEHDRVADDWFPLKPRPGKSSDRSLPISGALHLQLVVTQSIFSLFAPVLTNQLAPEEKYAQAVLKYNIKRVQNIVESLNLGSAQLVVEDILSYKNPLRSLLALLMAWALILFYPADWILPAIPLLLLAQLLANFVGQQERILRELDTRNSFHAALIRAPDSDGMADAMVAVAHQRAAANGNSSSMGVGAGGGDGADGIGGDGSSVVSASSSSGGGAAGGVDDDDEELDEEDDDGGDDGDEKRVALGFLGSIRRYQKQLAKVQTVIGKTCDKIEAVQNLFRWYDKRRSKMVALALVAASIFLLLVPFRWLLFAGVTARWSKKLLLALKKRRPRAGGKKPSEVDHFLERCQTDTSLHPTKIHLVEKLRKS